MNTAKENQVINNRRIIIQIGYTCLQSVHKKLKTINVSQIKHQNLLHKMSISIGTDTCVYIIRLYECKYNESTTYFHIYVCKTYFKLAIHEAIC